VLSNGTITVLLDKFQVPIWFYQICEKINPSNCDIANAKIPLVIKLMRFDASTSAKHYSGYNSWKCVNNGNGADSLNGIAVTSANTDVTPVTTGPLRIDADGNLTLAPNTFRYVYHHLSIV
jgi:hypothetical protein